ncbi:MAG: FG-GAP-like repeat-containing protein, partial [Nanoarchaeota archaeon]|nr:FG-GAP-like repeat-containing protein [Nanoarchaeota archaeon]
MNTAKILLICFILLSFAYFVNADDEYKPYLHKASVPEHPKIELYGQYKTNLFPGAATYSYGIEVPKGTNGLTPSLSVSYNSQTVKQRPGVLGTGWLLTQNYIYRDVNATLNDTSDDIYKLVLNNVQYELVYVSGSYHTKIESYMKIENLSTTSNTYYTYWLVTLKDGTTYRLGYNLDSELTSNTGYNYALKWSLDLIEDTHSNKIYYSYLEDPFSSDLGAVYLNEISYNNYEERKVKFIYESSLRQDYRLVYEQGNKLLESRKLQDLNIYAHDNLVRRYNFNYINLNTENSLSSLSEIRLYGSDNVSILHNLSFEYFPDIAGYTKHNSTYIPEELFSYTPTRPDYGVRLVDFNNDGLIDIIKARGAAGQNKSFVNNRLNNWTSVSSFISPVYISVIYNSIETDNGARFADINNDGFVDILYGKETGSNKKAYLNNGSGWSESATWATPVYFVNDRHVSQSVNLVDFNGDGRIDILHANNGITEAHLNTGSGWLNVSSSWQSPVDFISGDNDYAVRIVDLNGDNLPDITLGNWVASLKKAWLNNGSGWSNYTNYAPPVYFITDSATDNGARFTDVNGDGLPDLIVDFLNESNSSKAAYINTGDGWALSSKWQSTTPFTKNGYNIGRRLGDVNGDGFADIVVAQGNSTTSELYTYIKNSSNSYLLKRITNEYGGAIEIDYNSSTYYNNSANGTSTLGFNMRVVDKYNRNNSLNGDFNSFGTYAYSYFGGKYDYKEQEFRGFNIVNETKPDRSYTIHYFHQDDALKGKEYKTEIYDSSGNIFSRSSNGYSFTNRGYYEIFLDSSSQELYDGSSVPEISNVTYGYDSYGNVVYKDNKGDINKNNDEKYEIYEYYYNIDDYILDKVSKYSSYDYDNSTLAKQTRYYYDNGELTKGDLTKVIEWNEGGSDSFTSFDYDSYGNVVKKTNSLGRWTKYLYGLRDTSFTYVDRITNALGHRTDYYYNLGTGNLLWEEKENIRKTYTYDVFGRIKKEILPYDNSDMPTKEYTYTFDGLAPEIIKVSLKEHNGKTVDTYYFYDGFANLVQLKTEIEDDDSVVKNIFYDAQGRVEEEQNPYIENFSPSLSTPDSNVNKTYYT